MNWQSACSNLSEINHGWLWLVGLSYGVTELTDSAAMSSVDVEPLVQSFKRQRVAHQLLDRYVALSVFLDQYVEAPTYLLRMSSDPNLSKSAWESVIYKARKAFRILLEEKAIDEDLKQSLTWVSEHKLIGLIQDSFWWSCQCHWSNVCRLSDPYDFETRHSIKLRMLLDFSQD